MSTFAERVARLENDSKLLSQWPVTPLIREMLDCIREQQAALRATQTEHPDRYRAQAREVLEKWSLP